MTESALFRNVAANWNVHKIWHGITRDLSPARRVGVAKVRHGFSMPALEILSVVGIDRHPNAEQIIIPLPSHLSFSCLCEQDVQLRGQASSPP